MFTVAHDWSKETTGVPPEVSFSIHVPAVTQTMCAVISFTVIWFAVPVRPVTPPPHIQATTETPRGTLIGRVHNVTVEQPMPGITVRLRRWRLGTEYPPLATEANTEGYFRFEGLDTDVHSLYRAEADHHNVTFHSGFVSFEPGSTHVSVVLNVYETTDVPEDVHIKRFHFIILARERGVLSILELYQFGNKGNRAFIGTPSVEGHRETVRMALPAGARDLTLQTGTLGIDFITRPNELVATAPVLPGEETFDVAFVYLVPYGAPSLVLDRRLYYDTVAINGLLMDVGIKMRSNLLRFAGEREAQGQSFLQFIGEDLRAGQLLSITLDHLDEIRIVNAPGETAPDDAEMNAELPQPIGHSLILWAILSLGVLIFGLIIVYPSLRARTYVPASPSRKEIEKERDRLLLMLARLDEAYQNGQLSEAIYRRVRAQRKAELARLWERSRLS